MKRVDKCMNECVNIEFYLIDAFEISHFEPLYHLAILDALKQEVYEALEELTDYRKLLEEIKDADKNKTGETGEDH